MRLLKYLNSASYWILGTVMIVIGFGTIILALINTPLQLQIALGLIGLGFISLGLVQVKRSQDDDRDEKRFNQVIVKLDEIQQELHKDKHAERVSTSIADIISSGLKYYADQKPKSPKDE